MSNKQIIPFFFNNPGKMKKKSSYSNSKNKQKNKIKNNNKMQMRSCCLRTRKNYIN